MAIAGKASGIIAKMNTLTDPDMMNALTSASQAGVKIDLIVRGACSLTPGIQGETDNIHVISIIGRMLEHARIYYFKGQDALYISSADWMKRNLDRRVETLVPVHDPNIRNQLKHILQVQLEDTTASAYDADGWHRASKASKYISCQQRFLNEAITSSDT